MRRAFQYTVMNWTYGRNKLLAEWWFLVYFSSTEKWNWMQMNANEWFVWCDGCLDFKRSLTDGSSNVKWGYQDNFRPDYFSLWKYFEGTKTCHKQKSTNKTKISKGNNKGNNFSDAQKLLRGGFFCVLVLFYTQNIFVKKYPGPKLSW